MARRRRRTEEVAVGAEEVDHVGDTERGEELEIRGFGHQRCDGEVEGDRTVVGARRVELTAARVERRAVLAVLLRQRVHARERGVAAEVDFHFGREPSEVVRPVGRAN